MNVTYLDFEPRGAVRQLFEPLARLNRGDVDGAIEWGKAHPEVLVEGPAGTGKSRGALEYIDSLCELFPGIRVLICRQTLASLRESTQVTLEEKVWYPGHPCLTISQATREHRSGYTYPESINVVGGITYQGSSRIVLGGLDKPERTFSTEYDVVFVEEAIETSLDAWMKLRRVNRNWRLPWQQQIACTNPGSEFHWLNVRGSEVGDNGRRVMQRLLSRHVDNPAMWDVGANDWTEQGRTYVEDALGHMRGAVRKRLLDGLWVSEEGQVWEEYDPAVHNLACDIEYKSGHWWLELDEAQAERSRLPRRIRMEWFIGSMDFGFTAPGVFQLWGFDKQGRMYRLIEVFRRAKQPQWWADIVREVHMRFPMKRIVCDPAEPDRIEMLNHFLRTPGETVAPDPMSRIAVKANNAVMTGIDMVAWALQPGAARDDRESEEASAYDPPRLFLCQSAFDQYGMDRLLMAERRPASTEQEIPSYVWPVHEDGKPLKEKPDPACSDHGCDAMRYAVMFGFNRDLSSAPGPAPVKAGTIGALLGHNKVRNRPPRR